MHKHLVGFIAVLVALYGRQQILLITILIFRKSMLNITPKRLTSTILLAFLLDAGSSNSVCPKDTSLQKDIHRVIERSIRHYSQSKRLIASGTIILRRRLARGRTIARVQRLVVTIANILHT